MPSAEAKAADPNASITTVEKNYKKSPAQLRGVWEHLSTELFPYQPYYLDINKDYFDPDADASVIIYAKVCRLLEEADRPFGKKGLMAEFFQYKDDTNYPEGVTYGILIMNIVTPLLDKYVKPRLYGRLKEEKANG